MHSGSRQAVRDGASASGTATAVAVRPATVARAALSTSGTPARPRPAADPGNRRRRPRAARWIKAALDRLLAALGLLVLAPALLGIALAVRLTSRGPALFVQTRIGRHGKPFRMVKFRSMHLGAEDRVGDLREHNEAADGLLFKLRRDPRVTRVGRVLRRYSLDELPQLLNVLTGSMSLVGPRPALPSEVDHYDAWLRRRLLVRPGLTGLWQVSGRSDLSWDESVRLDLSYVDHWSLRLDVWVLVKTVHAVTSGDGAY